MDLDGKSDREQRELLKRLLAKRLIAFGYRRVKSEFVRTAGDVEVRAKIEKPHYSPAIDLSYFIKWIGPEITDIDPDARLHLFTEFGRPSRAVIQARKTVWNYPGEPMSEAERIGEIDRALAADWEALAELGTDREGFLSVFLKSYDEDRERYWMFAPAWRNRPERPKRDPDEGPDICIVRLPG